MYYYQNTGLAYYGTTFVTSTIYISAAPGRPPSPVEELERAIAEARARRPSIPRALRALAYPERPPAPAGLTAPPPAPLAWPRAIVAYLGRSRRTRRRERSCYARRHGEVPRGATAQTGRPLRLHDQLGR